MIDDEESSEREEEEEGFDSKEEDGDKVNSEGDENDDEDHPKHGHKMCSEIPGFLTEDGLDHRRIYLRDSGGRGPPWQAQK